jgi:hypothetical protein
MQANHHPFRDHLSAPDADRNRPEADRFKPMQVRNMFSSRTGKIACLPEEIRDELNDRMINGIKGPELLPWLNSQPEVRDVLTRCFGGRDINHQNLSAWRRGGFRDWLFRREMQIVSFHAYAARSAAAAGQPYQLHPPTPADDLSRDSRPDQGELL